MLELRSRRVFTKIIVTIILLIFSQQSTCDNNQQNVKHVALQTGRQNVRPTQADAVSTHNFNSLISNLYTPNAVSKQDDSNSNGFVLGNNNGGGSGPYAYADVGPFNFVDRGLKILEIVGLGLLFIRTTTIGTELPFLMPLLIPPLFIFGIILLFIPNRVVNFQNGVPPSIFSSIFP